MPKRYTHKSNKRLLETRNSALEADDVRPRKSLGQHFLSDKKYLRATADALELPKVGHWEPWSKVRPWEVPLLVEIGPGTGSLTAELLARGANVIAIEKDRRLVPFLQEKFSSEIVSGQLHLVESDALDFDPRGSPLAARRYQLAGNIPYYITGALLEKFLSTEAQPSRIVFLVQKEVAERIARSKKESLLSLSVKAYGEPRYIRTVPKGVFSPPPTVDSAIVAIEHISRKNFESPEHEKRFFELIRAGFAHKRKLLARNVEEVLRPRSSIRTAGLDRNYGAVAALKAAGIPEKARAEDVRLEQWLALANFQG